MLHDKVAAYSEFCFYFHRREVVIHALVIATFTNFMHFLDFYTKKLLHSVDFLGARSSYECVRSRGMYKFHAFFYCCTTRLLYSAICFCFSCYPSFFKYIFAHIFVEIEKNVLYIGNQIIYVRIFSESFLNCQITLKNTVLLFISKRVELFNK